MSTEAEIPLTGGMVNPEVVRIGDTVHRVQGENAAFAHQLLQWLAAAGFQEAPRYLGVDDKGREILTYFDGTVLPGAGFKLNDEQLLNVARLIRRYHDLTAGSFLKGDAEIIAHGELGPHNTVFQGDTLVGFIDWDSARPGTRLRDFAYAVDWYIDVANKKWPVLEQTRRLTLMCKAYGWDDSVQILRDIQTDYRSALNNHQRRGNKQAIKIFTDLVAWVDTRV